MSLCHWLRSTPDLSDIPFLLHTSRREPELRQLAKQAGCDYFIAKPAPIASLIKILVRVVTRGPAS